jgi:hypothetical protein
VIITKGFDLMMFKNYIGYVPKHTYIVFEQPIVPHAFIPHTIGNEFLIVVQLITSMDRIPIQQLVTVPLPTIV